MAKFTKAQQQDLNVVKALLRNSQRPGSSKAKQQTMVASALTRLAEVTEANK